MQAANIPVKFATPWASGAAGGNILAVPTTTANPNLQSLTLGYPPAQLTSLGAGGAPPDGRYENGIKNQMTAWLQWVQAGGAPIQYDVTFQGVIGGYPNGALVMSATTAGKGWFSTTDNNVTNPDSSGAGWSSAWLSPSNNLSDIPSASTARTNLGLGTMAVQNANAVAITGGFALGLSGCAINSASVNSGFTVTCPGPVLELVESTTGNTWVVGQNGVSADLNLSFNSSGVGSFDHTTGAYTATSDARLKQNVKELEAITPKLMQLRHVRFNHISDPEKRDQIGLIAQEFQEHFPEFVSIIPGQIPRDKVEFLLGEDGVPIFDEENRPVIKVTPGGHREPDKLGINYAGLSVLALKAIQELTQQVRDLRSDLDALKARN